MLLDLPRVSDELALHEIEIAEYVDAETGMAHATYRPGRMSRFRPVLRKHEKQVVDEMLDRFGNLSRAELISLAYATAPMRLIRKWEADSERLDGTPIPFGRALGAPREGLTRYRRVADAVRERNVAPPAIRAQQEARILNETGKMRRAVMSEEFRPRKG